jgi:hypothetical protein
VSELKEIQLAFELNGTCHQRVRIVRDNYDEESIIQGLKDGTLATTTWFDHSGFSWIEVVETGEQIGLIYSQEIEGEYFDYR